jgi:hypothetical protein
LFMHWTVAICNECSCTDDFIGPITSWAAIRRSHPLKSHHAAVQFWEVASAQISDKCLRLYLFLFLFFYYILFEKNIKIIFLVFFNNFD